MDWKVTLGRWLFRHRSFTPLPLFAAVGGYLAWGGLEAAQAAPVRPLVDLAALALVAAGVLLRLVVAGRAPAGTSGRGRRLEALQLVTFGPYAWTRNPLYLGNLLLCLGLLLEVGSPLIAAGALLFFALQYGPVIRAEEAYLRERFGAAFDAWCRVVPCFWPRPPVEPPPVPGPIDWRRAFALEVDTCFAAFGGFALWRWLAGRPPLTGLGTPTHGLVMVVCLYLAARLWKRLRRGAVEAT